MKYCPFVYIKIKFAKQNESILKFLNLEKISKNFIGKWSSKSAHNISSKITWSYKTFMKQNYVKKYMYSAKKSHLRY